MQKMSVITAQTKELDADELTNFIYTQFGNSFKFLMKKIVEKDPDINVLPIAEQYNRIKTLTAKIDLPKEKGRTTTSVQINNAIKNYMGKVYNALVNADTASDTVHYKTVVSPNKRIELLFALSELNPTQTAELDERKKKTSLLHFIEKTFLKPQKDEPLKPQKPPDEPVKKGIEDYIELVKKDEQAPGNIKRRENIKKSAVINEPNPPKELHALRGGIYNFVGAGTNLEHRQKGHMPANTLMGTTSTISNFMSFIPAGVAVAFAKYPREHRRNIPVIMEAIFNLEKRNPGRISMSFLGDHLYVAINNGKDTFELQLYRKLDESVIEEFKQDLLVIKDFIVSLKLNNKLFKKD